MKRWNKQRGRGLCLLMAAYIFVILMVPVSVFGDSTQLPSLHEAENSPGTVAFAIDQTGYTHNGQWQPSDVAPFIQDSRTMLPVRYAAQALGAQVEWLEESRQSHCKSVCSAYQQSSKSLPGTYV